MDTCRAFVAIELSPEAQNALLNLQNRLKGLMPPRTVRWTPPGNIHLTLHFLGDVPAAKIDPAAAALQTAARAGQPFALYLEGLGCFPNLQRPRIVWAGVLGNMPALAHLHQNLGRQLAVIGYTPETRPYSPHLTIGRVQPGLPARQLAHLNDQLAKVQPEIGRLAELPVQAIYLIKSELKPGGPLYTRLAHGMLGAG